MSSSHNTRIAIKPMSVTSLSTPLNVKFIILHGAGNEPVAHSEGETDACTRMAGMKQGKGKITFRKGDVYEGEWDCDRAHGKGIFTKKNGNVYEGEYCNDKCDGVGTYSFTNGDKYEGVSRCICRVRVCWVERVLRWQALGSWHLMLHTWWDGTRLTMRDRLCA